MNFDWYEATLEAPPEDVGRALLGHGDGMAEIRPRGGTTYGYTRAYDVAIGARVLASMFYGGGAQGPGVHVTATGVEARWWSVMCRERFVHEVTRCDVAEDYSGAGTFDTLTQLLVGLAKERGLRTYTAGDWAQCKDGRTLYVGSPTSPTQVRLYEKGKEFAARGIAGVPHDWTRLEGIFRPKRRTARMFLAAAKPAQCFGLSSWCTALYQQLTDCEVQRIPDVAWAQADDERGWHWLVKQYGPLLVRKQQAMGTWAAVGEALGAAITPAKETLQ